MSFKNQDNRKLISTTLRQHNALFRNYDKKKDQNLSVKLNDFDDLFSTLNFFVNDAKNNAINHLQNLLEISYLGVFLTGHLSLALQNDENKGDFIQEILEAPSSNIVLSSLIIQITNHSLSIIKLVTDGLDNSARTILRTLEELVYLTIYLAADVSKIKIYTDLSNTKETWYKNFRLNVINKELTKIETRLGLPDDIIQYLKSHRSDGYEFYSEYTHNSYPAIAVGAFVRSFNDEYVRHNSVFGKESIASLSTLKRINSTLFYFNLSIFQILTKEHNFQASASERIWRMTTALFECFKAVYLNYPNEEEIEGTEGIS